MRENLPEQCWIVDNKWNIFNFVDIILIGNPPRRHVLGEPIRTVTTHFCRVPYINNKTATYRRHDHYNHDPT